MWIVELGAASVSEKFEMPWADGDGIEKLSSKNVAPASVKSKGREISPNIYIFEERDVAASIAQEFGARVMKAPSFDLRLPKRKPAGPGTASTSSPRNSWAINFWNIDQIHESGLSGKSVKVGIADSGIDLTHPGLKNGNRVGRVKAFASFDEKGNITREVDDPGAIDGLGPTETVSDYHGTHCAGIICAGKVEDKGEGIAPGVDLYVANVMNRNGGGEVAQIYSGISWLKRFKCDVISLSLGWWGFRDHWAKPILELLMDGCVVVAASGNEYDDYTVFGNLAPTRSPGNYPFTNEPGLYPGYFLSVGAIDINSSVAAFSGGGDVAWPAEYEDEGTEEPLRPTFFADYPRRIVPTVVAPGVGICAPVPLGGYEDIDGTSQATPYVAGLVALVLEKIRQEDENASPRQAAEIVVQNLRDSGIPGPDDRYGSGLPDVSAIFGSTVG